MDEQRYLVDVRPILEDLGAVVEMRARVDLPAIEVGTERFDASEPASADVVITNTGAGIVAEGTVSAVFNATCSRCLREFPLPVTGEVEGFYVSHGAEHDLPEEQEYAFVEEGSVDLMGPILAALVLELPFAPLHAEDCPGICPTCGADLSAGSCACEPDVSASPFSALQGMFKEAPDEE